jgi:hypothetical protein
MPAQYHKSPNKHLIFVKNVPGYLAKDTIPKLFVKYNPMSVKNVYPNSSITTVVLAFPNAAEAAQAQRETDQMRVHNVILRVEGYNKQLSVRYLRENGLVGRPLGAVGDEADEHEADEGGYTHDETEWVGLPSTATAPAKEDPVKIPGDAPRGTTWANIAGSTKQAQAAVEAELLVPPETKVKEKCDPNLAPTTPVATPHISVAVPDITWPSTPKYTESLPHTTPSTTPPFLLPRSKRTLSPGMLNRLCLKPHEQDIEDSNVEPNRNSSFDVGGWLQKADTVKYTPAAYSPCDPTEMIRARHCQDCAFCKMREESRARQSSPRPWI